jgi:hypothetical protein
VSDEGGEVVDSASQMMTELAEADWLSLLGQFSMPQLYSVAIRYFTTVMHHGNRMRVLLSLISMTHIVLKLLNEGLETHAKMKTVCKRICDYMRSAFVKDLFEIGLKDNEN